ncbi:hypothetical protein [Dongshaea marina]|uniref:hypothetical protein n=1 Tax=Dongshaea marina TaxID=2047966 RepID=UPI000D3E45B3|nr:hypothetical protein [Dongshaea marina]
MKNKVYSRMSSVGLLCFSLLLLAGCAGTVKHMKPVSSSQVSLQPEPGKSLLVFMRPSGMAFGIQSSVFEIVQKKPELVGILAAKKKVVYALEPGKHLFMVVGESADFMSAELAPNKVYYARVTPRIGFWKARFSLAPVTPEQMKSPEFKEWLQESEWVELTLDSQQWARENMPSIESKYHKYYPEWLAKGAAKQPKLNPGDVSQGM